MSKDSDPRVEFDPAGLSEDDKRELLRLAREVLQDYLGGGGFRRASSDSAALMEPRATFVTLRRRDSGELRGCRGECVARRPLVDSVAQMAIAAASDPRFPPVMAGELPQLQIEISALTPLVRINPEEIVVGRHGLMLMVGDYSGLLLPQVPVAQGWDREAFLEGVCRKAGLPADAWKAEGVELFGFEAEVWGEEE